MAAGLEGAQPAARGNSDIQMADLQSQQTDGQEVDSQTDTLLLLRCAGLPTWWLCCQRSCCASCAYPTMRSSATHFPVSPAAPTPVALQAPPETAAGAAETAEERHTASDEAQLASLGDVGEWTVLHHQTPGSGTGAPVAAAKKQIAVMCVGRSGRGASGRGLLRKHRLCQLADWRACHVSLCWLLSRRRLSTTYLALEFGRPTWRLSGRWGHPRGCQPLPAL